MEPHKTVWLPWLLSNKATGSQREFTLHTTRWHQHINDIIGLWSHHTGLLSFAGENIPGDLRLHTFIKYFTQILTSPCTQTHGKECLCRESCSAAKLGTQPPKHKVGKQFPK